MTCTPQWPEIKNVFLLKQIFDDSSDLAARVCYIKLQALMAFVIDEKVFEHVKTYVRVIGFQTTSLPHTHCNAFMTQDSKVALHQPSYEDSIRYAEIPNEMNPILYQFMLRHNMHNLCGGFNPSAVCMDDKTCTKHFPKQFVKKTAHHKAQLYVTYRRRSPDCGEGTASWTYRLPGGQTMTRQIDRSWALPYSPQLSITFQRHINVVLCAPRVGGIKSFFKYVCKKNDRVSIWLVGRQQHYNEIGQFQDAQYFSASEAHWRLFQFEIIDKHPSVARLDVHLENRLNVYFPEGLEHQAGNQSNPGKKLTEWFGANEKWSGASSIK